MIVSVLVEPRIPHEVKSIRFANVKKKPLIEINSDGCVPAIEDPNINLTLCQSDAIIA
ncbi:hypothetical protein BJ166DRAFT_35005 [Pestalotiopsis sp. NC0098]|nr:hypothetical protein BJ166DRAFT_35005 [Pestalotiopsis sp. NC0098]